MPSKNVASGSIISLKDRNGELKFENKENANILKSFFENLATNLVNKLPDAPKRFNKTSTISFYKDLDITKKNFLFHSVDFDTVLDILSSINPHKACGIDDIAGRFLKDGASILAKPITQIFNLSIKLSIFPNNCKVAKLKPLYKKGSRSDPKNYRPISLLPLVSKVFEKLIHQQLQKYLDENKILYSFQSGFRANHSTDSCISYLQDKIVTGFDKGMLTGMIAIDLQKAFDTIDHTILLEKLSCLGLSNQVIGWLESYLCDRKFYVNIDNTLSDMGIINCGVPQVSILGTLLFLIYINDMSNAITSDLYLYADDSCILVQHKSIKAINEKLNTDFSNLCDWFVDNKLSIHFGEDKTKCILFASKNKIKKVEKLDISYNDIIIKQFSSLSYLGVILDATMSGEIMAIEIIKKINTRIKFLYRKDSFLNSHLRRLLCNALIQPHFDYVCSA